MQEVATTGSSRSRTWFGTIWNPTDIAKIKRLKWKAVIISADDQTQAGQIHWHALVQFKSNRERPRTINAHWEKPVSIAQAMKYITDKGIPKYQGGAFDICTRNSNDWKAFVDACKTKTPKEMIESEFSKTYARYRMFAGEVNNLYRQVPVLEGPLQNEWWWGAPGTGKTSKAFRDYPDLYSKSLNKWWDGYTGQKVVLIDDWDPRQEILIQKLKIWADRYPFNGETKGSSMMIRPEKIIVTSNYRICDCFQHTEDQDAIRRRFKVTHFQGELGH